MYLNNSCDPLFSSLYHCYLQDLNIIWTNLVPVGVNWVEINWWTLDSSSFVINSSSLNLSSNQPGNVCVIVAPPTERNKSVKNGKMSRIVADAAKKNKPLQTAEIARHVKIG